MQDFDNNEQISPEPLEVDAPKSQKAEYVKPQLEQHDQWVSVVGISI